MRWSPVLGTALLSIVGVLFVVRVSKQARPDDPDHDERYMLLFRESLSTAFALVLSGIMVYGMAHERMRFPDIDPFVALMFVLGALLVGSAITWVRHR